MIFAYLDESGNTGTHKDPDQPIHLIGCLLVEDVQIRPLEEAVRALVSKHFPELAKKRRFELHAVEVYGGKGPFKGVEPKRRIAFVLDLIGTVGQFSQSYGYAGVNKLKTFANDHPHCIAFALLVERLEPWLAVRGQLGLIVADENHEIGQRLIDDMHFFKDYATYFGYKSIKVNNIVDSVHFVQSKNNRIIQCCDLITYFFMKGKRTHGRLLAGFIAQGAPWDWVKYQDENASPAERATLEIYSKIGGITRFASKIFNE